MFDLRLLGWTMRTLPVSEVSRRLLPWTVVGFVIMVMSGTLLFIAIPLRTYQNIFLRAKMVMLIECIYMRSVLGPEGKSLR